MIKISNLHKYYGTKDNRVDVSYTHLDVYKRQHQVGWMVSRLVHDTMSIKESVAWNLFDMADGLSRLVIIFITMYLLNARLSLYVLASMPFIAIFTYIFQDKMMKAQKAVSYTHLEHN